MAPEGFRKKINLEGNLEIMKKTPGRKKTPKNPKDINDPNITIREIIDNYQTGEEAASEIKKRTEKGKKTKAIKPDNSREETKQQQPTQEPSTGGVPANPLALIAPQIMIVNGKAVKVDPVVAQEPRTLQVVQESKTKVTTAASFKKRQHTRKWAPEETRKFFKGLEVFGTEFTLISAHLFPQRSSDQLLNKFHAEEKANPGKVDEALKKHKASNKRGLKNRLMNFGRSLMNGEEMQEPPKINGNRHDDGIFPDLAKVSSNTSTDSMDAEILNELHHVFYKINKDQKNLALPAHILPAIEPEKKTNGIDIEEEPENDMNLLRMKKGK